MTVARKNLPRSHKEEPFYFWVRLRVGSWFHDGTNSYFNIDMLSGRIRDRFFFSNI